MVHTRTGRSGPDENKKAGRPLKKDNAEPSAGVLVSHPAIDSALYFSGLPATYFINKTCALWGRGTAAPSRFPACTGRSDAKAPRRIESLRAVSCYNEIITGCRQIVNEKTQFWRGFRHFFAHLSLGEFYLSLGRFLPVNTVPHPPPPTRRSRPAGGAAWRSRGPQGRRSRRRGRRKTPP